MTIDRRAFLMAGGATAGAAGLLAASDAQAAPVAIASRSVTEFGVEPDSKAEQTEALEKALAEIARSGHIAYIPGGSYKVGTVKLPVRCAITGVPSRTQLIGQGDTACFHQPDGETVSLSHLGFVGRAFGGDVAEATFLGVTVDNASGAAIQVSNVRSILVSGCRFRDCAGTAIAVSTTTDADAAVLVNGNHIQGCASGVMLTGSGKVSGNVIAGATRFGLQLGGGVENGAISAIDNMLRDCVVGIGVAAAGETILASLNLITGATDGAIRAFDGEKLVGPDLVQESSESYLNLTLVGNVAR